MQNMELKASCDYKNKWGVYDIKGNMIIKPKFDFKPKLSPSSDHYYIVQEKGKYGVLSDKGRLLEVGLPSEEDAINWIASV